MNCFFIIESKLQSKSSRYHKTNDSLDEKSASSAVSTMPMPLDFSSTNSFNKRSTIKKSDPLQISIVSKSCVPLCKLPRDDIKEDYEVTPTESVSCNISSVLPMTPPGNKRLIKKLEVVMNAQQIIAKKSLDITRANTVVRRKTERVPKESSSNFLNSSTDNPLSFYLKTNEDTDFIRNTLALAQAQTEIVNFRASMDKMKTLLTKKCRCTPRSRN